MNNVTDLTSIRASAVPSVPREISASQRLAALNHVRAIDDAIDYHKQNEGDAYSSGISPYLMSILVDSRNILRELAGDGKRDNKIMRDAFNTLDDIASDGKGER